MEFAWVREKRRANAYDVAPGGVQRLLALRRSLSVAMRAADSSLDVPLTATTHLQREIPEQLLLSAQA